MSASNQIHLLVALFVLILVLGIYHGLRGGLVRSAFKLVGLGAGFVLARPLAAVALPYVQELGDFELPAYARYIALFVCFVLVVIAFGLIGWLVSLPIRWSPLKWVDQLAGAGLGLFIGLLVVGLILGFLDDFEWFQSLMDQAEGWEAGFLSALRSITPDLFRNLGQLLEPLPRPTLEDLA